MELDGRGRSVFATIIKMCATLRDQNKARFIEDTFYTCDDPFIFSGTTLNCRQFILSSCLRQLLPASFFTLNFWFL